jgi:spore germination protein KC
MDLAIRNLKPVISTHIKNGLPVFDVRVKARGTILSQTGVQGDIDQLVNNEVRKEIMSTFMKGVDQHVDLFHLERVAYRWDSRLWKERESSKQSQFPLLHKKEIKHE